MAAVDSAGGEAWGYRTKILLDTIPQPGYHAPNRQWGSRSYPQEQGVHGRQGVQATVNRPRNITYIIGRCGRGYKRGP